MLGDITFLTFSVDVFCPQPVYIDMQTGFYMFPPNEDNIVKVAFHLKGWTNTRGSLSDSTKEVSVPRTGHFLGTLNENIPLDAIRQLRDRLREVYPELANKPFSGSRMCWYVLRAFGLPAELI